MFLRVGQKLALHVGETTISFPFTPEQAHSISASLRSLLETFAAKQKAERPRRWDMMEYRYKGTPDVPQYSMSLFRFSVTRQRWPVRLHALLLI